MKESHKLIDLKHLNTYTYLKGAFVECCFRHCWHVYGSQLLIFFSFGSGGHAPDHFTVKERKRFTFDYEHHPWLDQIIFLRTH